MCGPAVLLEAHPTCGASWSLDSYHRYQAFPFYEQVQNLKATTAYIGDKNKKALEDAKQTGEEDDHFTVGAASLWSLERDDMSFVSEPPGAGPG